MIQKLSIISNIFITRPWDHYRPLFWGINLGKDKQIIQKEELLRRLFKICNWLQFQNNHKTETYSFVESFLST